MINTKKTKHFPQYWLNSLGKFLNVEFISMVFLGHKHCQVLPSGPHAKPEQSA